MICYSWGCTPSYCCDSPTTTPLVTTTTPLPTTTLNVCGHFTCPAGWVKKPNADTMTCYTWGCTPSYCCDSPTTTPLVTTTTPCPTTTLNICGHFTCPAGWVKKPNSDTMVCYAWGCTPSYCCSSPTTTPCPTTTTPCPTTTTPCPTTTPCTTTTPLTCASYSCDKGWFKFKDADKKICKGGKCSHRVCCFCP